MTIYQEPELKMPLFATLTVFLIGVTFGLFGGALLRHFTQDEPKAKSFQNCTECHNKKMEYTQYFQRRNNPTPEAMAEAVLNTRSPRLLSAIAVAGEKNTPFWVRAGGYKKAHAGAWQLNERLHGRQSTDPVEQALAAERLLNELTDTKPIKKALSIYGGDTSREQKYAKAVLKELRDEVPR